MKLNKLVIFIINLLIFVIILYISLNKVPNKDTDCIVDKIEKIYDGDTVYGKKLGKIRILWIDTPEIYHKWWTQVKDYKFYACWEYWEEMAKKYLLNKKVEICFDKNDNKTWWYWRILWYIFFTWDNWQKVDFWKMLVKNAYAKVYRNSNFKYKKEYLSLEKEVKKQKKWIWSSICIEKDKKFKKMIKDSKN